MRTLKQDEAGLVAGGDYAVEYYSGDGFMDSVLGALREFTFWISDSNKTMTVGSSYFIRG